ncbi:hypothetical protein FHW83_004016 [Duganella sp. SG902]|uniref:hypothetical protein n=1 Tax=Duganella sp. SG902 TaxID=2587016 RepID=UPI00159E51A4|nr:hypothetical protein [Duganella sp. SG902]NVM78192.1 hypothetical protein [Duganella sp. SG902]
MKRRAALGAGLLALCLFAHAGPVPSGALRSPDGKSAAWQVKDDEIRLYRNGETRSLKCGPFIREFWFWKDGSQIAIDCGGSHFAGREILYDSATLKQLDSFDQAVVPLEKRPEWSSSGLTRSAGE